MQKSYSIHYLSSAERDLEGIFDYIQHDSPEKASTFVSKIDRVISRLARFPHSGSIPQQNILKMKGYRILILEDYLVFYRVKKKEVIIYRVLHGKRRYQFLMK